MRTIARFLVTSAVALPLPLAAQQPLADSAATRALQQFIGTWHDSAGLRFTGGPVAAGRAVRTEFIVPVGGREYRAESLWAFNRATRRIEVFEVNTNGQVLWHFGQFAAADSLVVERFAVGDSARVLQRSHLVFRDSRLRFVSFSFRADGTETRLEYSFDRSPR